MKQMSYWRKTDLSLSLSFSLSLSLSHTHTHTTLEGKSARMLIFKKSRVTEWTLSTACSRKVQASRKAFFKVAFKLRSE